MLAIEYVLVDHPALSEKADQYALIRVDTAAVLRSWRGSLFAHRWLDADGTLKVPRALGEEERKARLHVEEDIAAGKALRRPLLGIGILETVEFCMGAAEFLVLADRGVDALEVHIRAGQQKDFQNLGLALGLDA